MTRKFIVVFMLLATSFIPEAKQLKSSEGFEVLSTHGGIQNGSEFRTQSISADITGHVLTITLTRMWE